MNARARSRGALVTSVRVIRRDGVVEDLGRMGARPTIRQRFKLWRLRRRNRREG